MLAIGNPFNLTSTVTSGIVSAKGRNINILKGHFPIESFIQTDAAINPGNSGGALVNIKGQLVGINTAILSRTGYYAGYGFAIPVNLVKKIVNDLIEYAEVQRAFSGMTLKNIDTPMAEKLQIGALEGAIVTKIFPKGAAEKADIRLHDIIVAVNDKPINGNVAFEEIIGHSYPGDNLTLTIVRQKKSLQKKLTLLNSEGHTQLIKRNIYYSTRYKVRLSSISQVEKDLLKIADGVKIIEIDPHSPFYNFPENLIITSINNESVKTPQSLEKQLNTQRGRPIVIHCIAQNGQKWILEWIVP